jgi:NAD(P)-dependent dehydrogenase (short-subunit alcohol dehydrogenase family)
MSFLDVLKPGLFTDRTLFVTGGGSGINLGIARVFAQLGANITICGRTEAKLSSAAAELSSLGAQVCTVVADVRDYAAVAEAFGASEQRFGPVDTVVCGAAGNFVARAEDLSANGFKTVVDIDLLGSFNASRAAFSQLRQSKGCLIFISAAQAYVPFAYQAHVGAAKAGVDALMRNLALEWGVYGIRCNSVAPGPIEGTEGMKRLGEVSGRDTWTSMIPLGRYGTTDEVGAIVAVLASRLGAYVTGAQVLVDGGQGLTGSSAFNQAVAAVLPPTTDGV